MNKISQADKTRLLDAMDQISGLVEDGVDPNTAVVMVAKSAGCFPPGQVQLMVQAFNTAQANQQRSHGEDVMDKAAAVPLVCPDVVMESLFPTRAKSAAAVHRSEAISPDYFLDPDALWQKDRVRLSRSGRDVFAPEIEKRADARPDEQVRRVVGREENACWNSLRDWEKLMDQQRVTVEDCRQKLARSLEKARRLVQTSACEPFEEITQTMQAVHGFLGKALMDQLKSDRPRRILKTAAQAGYRLFDRNRDPYRTLSRCADETMALHAAQAKLASMQQNAVYRRAKRIISGAPALAPTAAKTAAAGDEKKPAAVPAQGGLLGGLRTGWNSMTSSLYGGEAKDWRKVDDKLLEELESPEHKLEMQKIRQKALLSDLISNDEVVSGYDPEEVMTTYNDLQRLAPRAVQQPAVLRAVLRRALAQGTTDVHELDQLLRLEESLRKSTSLDARSALIPDSAMVPIGSGRGYSNSRR